MYIFPSPWKAKVFQWGLHGAFFFLGLSVKKHGANLLLRSPDRKPPGAWASAASFEELVGAQTGILTEQAASATTTPQQLQKGGQAIFMSCSKTLFPSCLKLAIGKRTKPKQTPTVHTFLLSISPSRQFSCFAQLAFSMYLLLLAADNNNFIIMIHYFITWSSDQWILHTLLSASVKELYDF